MLTLKIVKDPPDFVSGFDIYHYGLLGEVCDLGDDNEWVVRKSTNVQITSQVERTEPEELEVEEHSGTDEAYDSYYYTKGGSVPHYVWKHASVEGEDTEALASDMECGNGNTNSDTKSMGGTGSITDDQEDLPVYRDETLTYDQRVKQDDLGIRFVPVITT